MTTHIRQLAARAQFTLGLTHDEMARMTGVSLRTAQRWAAGHSEPASFQLARVIPALYARDRELAAEITKAVGTTFERLGLEPADAKPAPPPPALVPLLAAAVDAPPPAAAPPPPPASPASNGA